MSLVEFIPHIQSSVCLDHTAPRLAPRSISCGTNSTTLVFENTVHVRGVLSALYTLVMANVSTDEWNCANGLWAIIFCCSEVKKCNCNICPSSASGGGDDGDYRQPRNRPAVYLKWTGLTQMVWKDKKEAALAWLCAVFGSRVVYWQGVLPFFMDRLYLQFLIRINWRQFSKISFSHSLWTSNVVK